MTRIGSLFSGIGGLELGLEWAGVGRVVWQVERDPFARSVLARHWPDAERFDDVRTVGAHNLEPADVVCGGFPCQDVSSAGKGAGLAGSRSGLWREFRRIVAELRPRVVVVENVASGKARWLCEVRSDLRELGYDSTAYAVAAADIGAPHRRARIFLVAHTDGVAVRKRAERLPARRARSVRGKGSAESTHARAVGVVDMAHTDNAGRARIGRGRELDAREWTELGDHLDGRGRSWGGAHDEREAPQSRMGRGPHGLSAGVDDGAAARPLRWPAGRGERQHEWEPPRAAIPGPYAAERLAALGNAVVPQCAEVVGRVVKEILDHAESP